MDHIITELFKMGMLMGKAVISIIMVAFMKETFSTIKLMEMEHIMILSKHINIMDSGKMTLLMEKEKKNSKMDHIMKEISLKESNQDLVIMFAILGFLRDNFQMEILMVMEFLLMLTTVSIMVNGKMD